MNDPIIRLQKTIKQQNKIIRELKADLKAYEKVMQKMGGEMSNLTNQQIEELVSESVQDEIQQMFDCIYQWGRVGVVTDAECPTMQRYITHIVELCGGTMPYDVCSNCGAKPMTANCNNANCDK